MFLSMIIGACLKLIVHRILSHETMTLTHEDSARTTLYKNVLATLNEWID
jgi:hypothetical protein